MDNVRTRMAPSPTGFFHIGNAKTALYNWLLARQTGGTFILRLEDTDAERSKVEYEQVVAEALTWLGITWDEGPGFDGNPDQGDFGPYRQSQRTELYRNEAQRLIDEGTAYRCFCTKADLDAERERAGQGAHARYSGKCRNLTPEDTAAKGDAPYSVRFKVQPGVTEIPDVLQGTVRVDNKEFDDFIIVKPNRDAVFHLAVVVDDGLMKVSHVIRGDDHLTNAARHVMLFNALGYDLPVFIHHPLVHDEHGKKYSKRLHGANLLDWREDGYLPEAIVNYLVLLGWAPSDDRELFSPDELINEFSIDRMSLSAGKFDLKKVQWLNGQHIRRLTVEELRDRLLPIMEKAGLDVESKSPECLAQMTAICQEKIATLNDIVGMVDYFFDAPTQYEEKGVKKQWRKADSMDRMRAIREAMESVGDWTTDALHTAYQVMAEKAECGMGKFIHPTRLALTGKGVGPGLFELAELLGKDACIERIDKGIKFITEQCGETPADA